MDGEDVGHSRVTRDALEHGDTLHGRQIGLRLDSLLDTFRVLRLRGIVVILRLECTVLQLLLRAD